MKTIPILERLAYALIVVLSLAALLMLALSPAVFTNVAGVYQGF